MKRHIYLIGGRASGKTTVGKLLATALGTTCVDTDDVVVQLLGMPIAKYVSDNGWDAFRVMETQALELVAGETPCVVACGGGIILRSHNRSILRKGIPLYLHAPAKVLAARLAKDPLEDQRPSLTGKSLTEEVAEVLAEREPLYREIAHAVLQCDQAIDTLVQDALQEISRIGA